MSDRLGVRCSLATLIRPAGTFSLREKESLRSRCRFLLPAGEGGRRPDEGCRRTTLALLLTALLTGALPAATITAVGCLGNSGGAGPGLVRVGDPRLAGGVAVDADGTLWTSGGDRLNHLGLGGQLLESHRLEPAGAQVTGTTLALHERRLFALGRVKQQTHLFALDTTPGAVARPLGPPLPKRLRDWVPEVLCPQAVDGALLLAAETRSAPPTLAVFQVDPLTGARTPRCEVPGRSPSGLAWDAQRRVLYLGGLLGDGWAITALGPDGAPAAGQWPVPATKTPAIPTAFVGRVSLAGGALWDSAHYGFLARLGLDAQVDPGRVVEWHHDLGSATQVVQVPGGDPSVQTLLLAGDGTDSLYWANWDSRERELRLVRRFGCLPAITSLALTDDGWVSVGTFRGQLWWRFDDAADAPPAKVDMHTSLTPLFCRGEQAFGLGALYRLDNAQNTKPWPLVFGRRRGDRNEARRFDAAPPCPRVAGLAVQTRPGRPDAALWVTDPAGRRLLRARFALPSLEVDARSWQPVELRGLTLSAPGDVVAIDASTLLLVDGSRLYKVDESGTASLFLDDGFGPQPRLDSDGRTLLVSDTARARLVWYDLASGARLAQFGDPDHPGDDGLHLDHPAQVALRGGRAVVADAGNQRIIRLELNP